MSDFSKAFDMTVPAGNTAATVTTFANALGDCVVDRILIRFPLGCSGLVGVQVQYAHTQIYPFNPGAYIKMDGYVYEQVVTNQATGGQWSIAAFNQDFVPHTIEVIYEASYIRTSSSPALSAPVSL